MVHDIVDKLSSSNVYLMTESECADSIIAYIHLTQFNYIYSLVLSVQSVVALGLRWMQVSAGRLQMLNTEFSAFYFLDFLFCIGISPFVVLLTSFWFSFVCSLLFKAFVWSAGTHEYRCEEVLYVGRKHNRNKCRNIISHSRRRDSLYTKISQIK